MTSDAPDSKVFPHDSQINWPITVDYLPLNSACAPTIWPAIGSLPISSEIPVNEFAIQLSEGRLTRTKAQRRPEIARIRPIRALNAPHVAFTSVNGINSHSKNNHVHQSTATIHKGNVLASPVQPIANEQLTTAYCQLHTGHHKSSSNAISNLPLWAAHRYLWPVPAIL